MPIQLVCLATLLNVLSLGAVPQTTQPSTQPATQPTTQPTPQAEDPKAAAVAERVMKRLGGAKAWEQTRYLTWNFFGARTHVWDKHRMRDRIDFTSAEGDAVTLVVDLDTKTGRAWINGEAVTDKDTLAELMDNAHAMWVNDSYWLVMPYKLRDPGVHLRYAGDRTLEDGTETDVLELTFDDGTGRTPQNKYDVFVDKRTDLVVQWDYYEDAAQRGPTLSTPWKDWKKYGNIRLSGDRGELRGRPAKLTDIAVLDELPDAVFTEPAKPKLPES